ncbi:MAG: dihydropyrimidinase [Chloroflexi bacterium]|nr:dihydropyrimidinase [Chloroflexota bacterium]
MDMAIRNGRVVSASGTFVADVGVDGGRIVQIGRAVPQAAREIDAAGMLVMPGCVDIHTHLSSFGGRQPLDDFAHGTRAAAAGGVTTICDFAHQLDGEGLRPAVERALADGSHSIIDFTFHTVLRDPNAEALSDIADLVADGFAGLKVFMSQSRFTKRVNDYLLALRMAGRAGALTAIHAEDESIITLRTAELLRDDRRGVEWFPASRPPMAEEVAVRRAVAFAEAAEAPIYLVHLSCQGALDGLRDARLRGLPVYGETRPIYLYLTRDVFDLPDNEGAKFVGQPPLRERADVDAIWNALRSGDLSTVCTDHIPYQAAVKKDPAHTFATIPPGMSNLETLLPMLYSEGVRKGRISVERLVDLVATSPARIAGLAPRKGAVTPGADADLVVFDPNRTRTIRAPDMHSAADYDVFEGWEVTGWPALTISRGDVIFEDGRVTGTPGRGQFVKRSRFAVL